jgi:hypothetical protein
LVVTREETTGAELKGGMPLGRISEKVTGALKKVEWEGNIKIENMAADTSPCQWRSAHLAILSR